MTYCLQVQALNYDELIFFLEMKLMPTCFKIYDYH